MNENELRFVRIVWWQHRHPIRKILGGNIFEWDFCHVSINGDETKRMNVQSVKSAEKCRFINGFLLFYYGAANPLLFRV